VKLAPKPQPKAKKESPGASSTQPTDKASSYTGKRPPKMLTLDGATYTGVDQHGQAEDTAYQKSKEKPPGTTTSIGIFVGEPLSEDEETEFFNLGVLMAQMKWLSLHSDNASFRNGVLRGEGVINAVAGKDDFAGVVLYKASGPKQAKQPKSVEMSDPRHLFIFVSETAKELYRRGILR